MAIQRPAHVIVERRDDPDIRRRPAWHEPHSKTVSIAIYTVPKVGCTSKTRLILY
jgi:hypothetical protein